ncbi:hypothetical protein ON010_g14096 [Phytophthora cinnamomi]|nr:hypothetical protein ON010_g14096 [Phytophthora cinnamomi]
MRAATMEEAEAGVAVVVAPVGRMQVLTPQQLSALNEAKVGQPLMRVLLAGSRRSPRCDCAGDDPHG